MESLGLFPILGVIFIVLKLCHVIAWSWWFVLMPFYLPPVALIGGVLAFAIWRSSQ